MGIHSGNRPNLNAPPINVLYDFTSHTFTSAGNTSISDGPTLTDIQTAYSSQPWASNTAYLNMTTQGIQRWTVPETATYRITACGGAGGRASIVNDYAGYPAHIRGDFNLSQGDILNIIVGQKGEGRLERTIYDGGGGGGSFVWLDGTDATGEPLIVAGGGGGGCYENYPVAARENSDALAGSPSGQDSFAGPFSFQDVERNYSGGAGGFGGQGSQGNAHGAGGGGWRGNGQTPIAQSNPAYPGKSPFNGGQGGLGSLNQGGDGGFGGGGGGGRSDSQGAQGPGGGGGYSGGAGASDTGAGGGGSYNSGANQLILTPPTGQVNGFVIIDKL